MPIFLPQDSMFCKTGSSLTAWSPTLTRYKGKFKEDSNENLLTPWLFRRTAFFLTAPCEILSSKIKTRSVPTALSYVCWVHCIFQKVSPPTTLLFRITLHFTAYDCNVTCMFEYRACRFFSIMKRFTSFQPLPLCQNIIKWLTMWDNTEAKSNYYSKRCPRGGFLLYLENKDHSLVKVLLGLNDLP